jgi:hypothetical protein
MVPPAILLLPLIIAVRLGRGMLAFAELRSAGQAGRLSPRGPGSPAKVFSNGVTIGEMALYRPASCEFAFASLRIFLCT